MLNPNVLFIFDFDFLEGPTVCIHTEVYLIKMVLSLF